MAITRGTNERPTVRVLSSPRSATLYVVELRGELILIREKGRRRGGRGEIVVTPGAIYTRALMVRADAERAERRAAAKARKRKGAR